MVTWLGAVPTVVGVPLSLVPSSTSPISTGVFPVAGFTELGILPGPNSSLLVTTTFTVTSAEGVVPPFSVRVYFTVYSPAGVLADTFTLPVAVSIFTPELVVSV